MELVNFDTLWLKIGPKIPGFYTVRSHSGLEYNLNIECKLLSVFKFKAFILLLTFGSTVLKMLSF